MITRTRFVELLVASLLVVSCDRAERSLAPINRPPQLSVTAGEGTWTTKASMPTARWSLAAGAVNGILYAVGGTSGPNPLATVEAFDPATNTWTTKASMPAGNEAVAAGVVNGILYVVGGGSATWAYDPGTDTWMTKASIPAGQPRAAAGVVNGIVYVAGGFSGPNPLATVQAYDPATDLWTSRAPMPTARWGPAAGVVNGILYVVGGCNSSCGLTTVEAYDPATDTWTTKAPMPTGRFGLAAEVLNGILYAIGGSTGGDRLGTVEAYDPATDTWTSQAPLPTARKDFAAGVVDGILYAVGGVDVNYLALATNEAFQQPSSCPWPNEPTGFTLINDYGFSDPLASGQSQPIGTSGWYINNPDTVGVGQPPQPGGTGAVLASDNTAPCSPPSVMQLTYPTGFEAGWDPAKAYYDPSSPTTETYWGFWWKPSNPWQNHSGSGINKIAFMFTPTAGSNIYIEMDSTRGQYEIHVAPYFPADTRNLAPNQTATVVTLGAWHEIEWYVKYATTGSSRDGVVKWWLDGVLQGNYTDLQTPSDAGFAEYQFAPIWGGVGGTKSETDYYWYAHSHISRR